MYGILYTSSEYYDYDECIVSDEPDTDKLCIICWLPSKYRVPVKTMKEFSFFLSECDCNAFIHSECLATWIQNDSSCPICRKKVSNMLIMLKCDDKYIKLTKNCLICFRYIFYLLKLASFFTTVYVSFYVFYVFFFLDVSLFYDYSINETEYQYHPALTDSL